MMVAMTRAVLCLCLWVFVSEVRGLYVPQEMNRTIQNLLQHYKISWKEKFNGKPVFSRELLTGKTETRMVFMGGVLETYETLINHMLSQLPTPSPPVQPPSSSVTAASSSTVDGGTESGGDNVRKELMYILKKVQELKKFRYEEQEKLLQRLQTLKHIQVDSRLIQSKALWELPRLYEEASVLSDNIIKQQRRRRQAKAKAQPRA